MSEYFPKPGSLGTNVKVELDLSNYATKTHLKNATGIDCSKWFRHVEVYTKLDDLEKKLKQYQQRD